MKIDLDDEWACAMIEREIYRLQREDLAKFWTELPSAPMDIARWHMYCRVEGFDVRGVDVLLTTAKDNFLKSQVWWRRWWRKLVRLAGYDPAASGSPTRRSAN